MEVLLMPSEEYIRDLESNRIFRSYGYDEGYKDGYKKGYEDGKKASSDRKEDET
jgi:flagellar biosynthesis/type III secretory pathway protein FliH